MGLTNRKEEQLKKMPSIETRLSKSKDGRYILHRTIITNVRPVAYYRAIIESDDAVESEEFSEAPAVSA